MDTKALRQKILDLAIRGKLVPQDPNDEPASVLLERIRAEKQQMVKDGKLKAKDIKNDSIIFVGEDSLHYEKFADGTVKCIEDEIPFDVPEGWEWTRLSIICEPITDGTHQTPTYSRDGYIFLSAKNVTTGKIDWDNVKYILENLHNDLYKRIAPRYNDILLAKNGTVGKAAIVDRDCVFDIYVTLAVLRIIKYLIPPKYLLYAISSSVVQTFFKKSLIGIGVQNLHLEHIRRALIPIPPIEVQHRIVDCIENYNAIIDSLETDINIVKDTISVAKSKILDLAIRGKLVPQDPNDEPASVLLERIRAEKKELIKQGKIKRDKKESVIFKGEDNSYYDDIPESWSITSLGELTTSLTLNDGDWILSDNMSPSGKVKLVQLGSVGSMQYIDKGFKYLTEEMFYKLSCTQIHPGYLLINRILSDKMCACILPEINGKLITTVDTCWIAPDEEHYNIEYLLYAISSPKFQAEVLMNSAGTTRKRISKSNLIKLPIAFPPLAEQQRIIDAIENIFSKLDAIADNIS